MGPDWSFVPVIVCHKRPYVRLPPRYAWFFSRSPTTSEDFQPVLDQMAMRTLDFARADGQPSRDGTLGVKLIHAVRMEKPFSFLMRW